MHKTSVTFPAFDWQRDGIPMDNMACNGLTAPMHQKLMGGNEKRSSLVPPITQRKLSASKNSSSSSKDQNGATKQKNWGKSEERKKSNFEVHDEIGFLETEDSSNRSKTSGKLSNMGQKFPDILKPKEKSTAKISTNKRQRHTKRGKKKFDGKSTCNGVYDVPTPASVDPVDMGAELKVLRDDFSEWARRLEWSITRPFTYSYFPKIHQKRKKNGAGSVNGRGKKTERKRV